MNPDNERPPLNLPGGRTVSYMEFGDPHGFPSIYFHGTPGSALEGAVFHQAGLSQGVRVLALDRPGVAGSSPTPSRMLSDYATDVHQVARQLHLPEYSVFGWSGGAAYALAVGAQLAQEVRAIGLLSPQVPQTRSPNLFDRAMTRAFHHLISGTAKIPAIADSVMGAAFWMGDITRRQARVAGVFRKVLAASAIRGTKNGAASGVEDSLVLQSRWDLTIEQMAHLLSAQNPPVPIWAWQGGKDLVTSTDGAMLLESKLPDFHLQFDKYASHLQVLLDNPNTVLRILKTPPAIQGTS